MERVFKQIFTKLVQLPYVLTHGDFGPFNIYPKGAIDLGSFFDGVLGYDLVSAIHMTDFFPASGDYEIHQRHRFSESQKQKYFNAMDKLFVKNKLPKLSEFRDEFILCRCLWVAARMHKWPKIQAFRYQQLDRLLKTY
jgi:hypothetical protein